MSTSHLAGSSASGAKDAPHVCWHIAFLSLMAATWDLESPKFLNQRPRAKSVFIHLTRCSKILPLSNFEWLEKDWKASVCTLSLLPALDLRWCWNWGRLPRPMAVLRMTELSVGVLRAYHVQTVLANRLWWRWWRTPLRAMRRKDGLHTRPSHASEAEELNLLQSSPYSSSVCFTLNLFLFSQK